MSIIYIQGESVAIKYYGPDAGWRCGPNRDIYGRGALWLLAASNTRPRSLAHTIVGRNFSLNFLRVFLGASFGRVARTHIHTRGQLDEIWEREGDKGLDPNKDG